MRAGGFAVPEDEQHGSGNDRKPEVDHAISHPTRREILRTLLDGPGEVVLSNGVLPAYAATVSDDAYVIEVLESSRGGDERR